MTSWVLEIDELAGLVGFLNAKKLLGMDEALFRSFSEENLPRIVAKLEGHGYLTRAERPGTYHFDEDLMQALAVAVSPDFVVLSRSKARPKSLLFYVAGGEVTEVVVTDERAVVTKVFGIDDLGARAAQFLKDSWPAEVAVARVKNETFDAGKRLIGEEERNGEEIAVFVKGAIAELGKTPVR